MRLNLHSSIGTVDMLILAPCVNFSRPYISSVKFHDCSCFPWPVWLFWGWLLWCSCFSWPVWLFWGWLLWCCFPLPVTVWGLIALMFMFSWPVWLFWGWLLCTQAIHAKVSQGWSAQFYLLLCSNRSCRLNLLSRPVTVYWHQANQF